MTTTKPNYYAVDTVSWSILPLGVVGRHQRGRSAMVETQLLLEHPTEMQLSTHRLYYNTVFISDLRRNPIVFKSKRKAIEYLEDELAAEIGQLYSRATVLEQKLKEVRSFM